MEREGGQREDRHDDGGDGPEELGVPLDEGGPAGGEAGGQLGLRPVLGEGAALAPGQGAHADQGEQRGEEGDGGGDREDDGEGGGDGDAVEEAQPQDQHAEQGDADGGPGEDDGAAGGGDGGLGGLGDGEAAFEAPAVPGDDEERVVDADAEAHEHAEHRGEVRDRHHVPEEHDPGVGDADADEGGGDGERGSGEGAEGEEEDDGGDGDADGLRDVSAGGLGEGDDGAAQLDLEVVGRGGPGGVDDGLRLPLGDVVGLFGEGDGGVGGASVLADPARRVPVGGGHGGDAGQFGDLAEHAGHALLDGVGADAAALGVPDDGVAVAAEAVEAPFEEGGGAAGLGAGDLVVVGVRVPREDRPGAGPAEGEEPEEDGDEAVPDAPPGDGCQRTCSLGGSWIFPGNGPIKNA